MTRTIALAGRKPRVDLGTSPADILRQMAPFPEEQDHLPAQVWANALTNGQARIYAMDCLISLVQGIIEAVDPMDVVLADERLAHLDADEHRLIADLIDRCKATVECDFDWEVTE